MSLIGRQLPTLSSEAVGDTTRGDEAVEFARWCGLTLYPWQEDLLRDMCRTNDEGVWAAREVVVSVARQNGKGEVLLARELAGIFLFGERLIFHSAHFLDTAVDAQRRLFEVIESHPDLMGWWDGEVDGVPKASATNGKENIVFPNGAMVMFRTRTKKTGRGLAVDLLVLDECFDLPTEVYAALGKTIRARESAQAVFISSPVNRVEHAHGAIFSAKRYAGIDGAEGVLFREWSMPEGADPFAQSSWEWSNPSLVTRGAGAQLSDIRADAASAKNSEVLRESFLVESLGVGNWCPRDGEDLDGDPPAVSSDVLDKVMTVEHLRVSGSMLSIDASPDRSACSVSAGGRTPDGRVWGGLMWHGPLHVDSVVAAVVELCGRIDPTEIVVDPKSPAEVLLQKLIKAGIDEESIHRMTWAEVKSATSAFLSGVDDRSYVLAESQLLRDGFEVARLREDSEGGVAWKRASGVICQVVATSTAMWAAGRYAPVKVDNRPAAELRPVRRARDRIKDF